MIHKREWNGTPVSSGVAAHFREGRFEGTLSAGKCEQKFSSDITNEHNQAGIFSARERSPGRRRPG